MAQNQRICSNLSLFLIVLALKISSLMGRGCVMSSPCISCTQTYPQTGDTWQMSVDKVNNRTLFNNPSSPFGCPFYKDLSSLDNLYYVVNAHDKGLFEINQDMSFLKKKWANSSVSFSGNNAASFIVNNNENLVGDSLTSTAVLSFEFTFTSAGDYLCFGISTILNLNLFPLQGTDFYASSGNGACVQPANANGGYFVGLTTGTCLCLPCGSSCSSCTSPNSNSACTACYTGYYLQPSPQSTTCLTTCPNGYWKDDNNHICSPCNSSCSRCSGPANTQCSSCNSSYFLQPNSTTCSKSCPSGYDSNSINNICIKCDPTCLYCSGTTATQCTVCYPGTYLYYLKTGGQCLNNCPNGYWQDNSINTCRFCSNPKTDPSSCPGHTQMTTTTILSAASSTLPAALSSVITVFDPSTTVSGMFVNLFLCLSAIDSIANMQYLNINHSQIALGAYSGLSNSVFPNWIATFNHLDNEMLILEYGVFEKNQMSSLYLDNYGDSITGIMVYSVLSSIFGVMSITKTKEELMNGRIGKIYNVVFGLFVSTISGNIQSQILYSTIQLLRLNLFVDLYSRMSYLVAYLLLSVVVGLQILCFLKVMTIFKKKIEVIKAKRLKDRRMRNNRRTLSMNNFVAVTMPPSVDDRWDETKYAMFFDSFKETSKHSFVFTYWMTVYSAIYILLILSLQSLPVLQCLSITILVIICILFSATIKPFKERSVAFLFFFNFATILVLAFVNLTLAIKGAVNGPTPANDQVGWAIFYMILVNSSTNMIVGFGGVIYKLVSLCTSWIKRKRRPTKSAKQQAEIASSNQPLEDTEEQNQRKNLQNNNQSNVSPLRNADSLAQNVSDQHKIQEHNHKTSIKIINKREIRENISTIDLEPRQILPEKNTNNHRKIHLDVLLAKRIQRFENNHQNGSRTTRKN